MGIAEEKYDEKRGLYYDHTTIYKKKEGPDTRDATRRRIENLEERVTVLEEKLKLDNKHINNVVNRYHELYNDLSVFKRWVINEKKNSR